MDWERVNVWTNTLYALIHSLHMAKEANFGDLSSIDLRARESAHWVSPDCSYESMLLSHQSHGKQLTFRRDPNKHFRQISEQVIKMLIQDLVVILDEMMDDALAGHNETAGNFPQSKVQKLSTHLDAKYQWSAHGCLELIAARNVLSHAGGKWNAKSIAIVSPFLSTPPAEGDSLTVGYTMLFNYRKAIRTFLNEVSPA